MKTEYGEIIIYQSEDGQSLLEVHLQEETVWLTQKQMAHLFDKDVRTINEHVKNIFSEGELLTESTIRKFRIVQKEGKRSVARMLDCYNLDVIISVGYRVKSIRGTQFRVWATSVLKDHLIKGYTTNERRLAEKGLCEMEQAVELLTRTLNRHETLSDEGRAVLEVVNRYAKSWTLLLQYDEDQLELPKDRHPSKQLLEYEETQEAIAKLKTELNYHSEATELFGREGDHQLQGILGNIYQTFEGEELFPSAE